VSWDQLRSIIDEARAAEAADRDAPPKACPLCGEPLRAGGGGTLHCTFDGWTWP
jgi:hypothetical protein